MDLIDAIKARHSVRHFVDKPISQTVIESLRESISMYNRESDLNIQLVLDEPKAFKGILSYGAFSGVRNYLVIAGNPDNGNLESLHERVGYYGEKLVLQAVQHGLGTCWVALTYKNVRDAYQLSEGEKVIVLIALGYPEKEVKGVKKKSPEKLGNVGPDSPEWFRRGVGMASLCPTAVNQQKFFFEYKAPDRVAASAGSSIIGYTHIDLGIAKLHFEIGAGKENFKWE